LACLVTSLERSGQLSVKLEPYLQKAIPPSSGMNFSPEFGKGSVIVAPEGVSYFSEVFMHVQRTVTDPEEYLTLATNLTAQFLVGLNATSETIMPHIQVFQLQGFHVSAFASDVPKSYQEEIAASDWSTLTKKSK